MTMSPEFAESLLDQMPIGIGIWDAEGASTPEDLRLIYANEWARNRLLDGLLVEPVGMTVREIGEHYHRQANAAFIAGCFEAATAQRPKTDELINVYGRVYHIHYKPVGKVVAASIFEDVTAIAEANAKLSVALESAKAGMWNFDYVNNRQVWDSGTAALVGAGEAGELGNTWMETMLSVISSKDAKDTENLLTRALETPGVMNAELEFRIEKPNGPQVTVMDRVRIYRDEHGLATQATHVLIDITDKAHLNAQLQQSNSDLKNFAHVASHDLREPLRVVINYTTLLFEEFGDKLNDPTAKQYREFIETSAARAMALVDDLLRFSRAGNNMNPQSVPLNRLVQIATENLKVAIDEAGARIDVQSLPVVTCDAGMMVQVFQNLIGNAVKFSAASGAPVLVIVSAVEKETHWLISVQDQGIGIEPEYLDKIFTPFYRLYSVAEYAGTGIGLALCQKIIRAHGGEIWAESRGRGQGTTLSFTLPKAA